MQRKHYLTIGLLAAMAALYGGGSPPPALSAPPVDTADMLAQVRATGIPDYNSTPNWANSPPLRKFVDGLPLICGDAGAGQNGLGQCIPKAVPDIDTYPGSDYYEIEIVQYREQVHSDLPPVRDSGGVIIPNANSTVAKIDAAYAAAGGLAASGGTLFRGYRQLNGGDPNSLVPHNLGPVIVATKDRPVRIKFTNSLPAGAGGDLFIPVDQTVMGSGPGPDYNRTGVATDTEVCADSPALCFAQNRANIHLHGGRTPWISDGTAHQWITPATEYGPGGRVGYDKGASVSYVPDMWFLNGVMITDPSCAGKTSCSTPGATNNPGPGSQTYYYTNAQSARMMFYHDHSWGITRLNVYAGGVAGYLVTDDVEGPLVGTVLPDANHTIPLIIQDKTFVNADTILTTDPTWIWGSDPGTGVYGGDWSGGATPMTGDLWWPHVYVPAQNPYNPDFSGVNPFGRWHYGPWFWPPTDVPNSPIPNPYYNPTSGDPVIANQPPEIPSTPNPSWGAEAFMDTPVVNGTAYPTLNVDAAKYRFRILNGAHDRFWNLQMYVADDVLDPAIDANVDNIPDDCPTCTVSTEIQMVPAVAVGSYPPFWPTDFREGGVPDPAYRGPAMVQIMNEGGFLPKPAVLPNQPVNWNVDPTTFTAGLVLQQNQGGGTLMLGPAERADVIVDFTQFAGKTLILYNDAPAPWPALDPHYDYYTGAPDNTEMGGSAGTLAGRGPNTRTIMQITVGGGGISAPNPADADALPDTLGAIQTAFTGLNSVFAKGQEPLVVGQKGAYNPTGAPLNVATASSAYNDLYLPPPTGSFPVTWPNWGISRITDTSLSFLRPDGVTVTKYPIEPKAIQDEMGETFDEFGRMSAKLGLELAFTTANIQTFVLQNFVDPPTEFVAKDQVQIWKITHNGVDTHPVHFHLFETQVLNRVGWDGFIYLPDPNELGWKDTVRISPLEDTIVALRPAKIPVPFTVPNSMRPLNPAYPLGVPAGFTGIDPKTAQPLQTPVVNAMYNFGHEYLWHCHILSHEEADMMRPIVLNANSLLYTDNEAGGFNQWNRGEWSLISAVNPSNIVASGSFAYASDANGLSEWNGYTWRKITNLIPTSMVASGSMLYANFSGLGLYQWNGGIWKKINQSVPTTMVVSESMLYANFTGSGLYRWNGTVWTKISSTIPTSLEASGAILYANFTGLGLYRWNGTVWTKISSTIPTSMEASGAMLYANFTGLGLYRWNGTVWTKISSLIPTDMAASDPVLYANFTDRGLYQWNGTVWTKINTAIPTKMDASGSILYANFAGIMRKWEFGAWTDMTGAPATAPVDIVAGF